MEVYSYTLLSLKKASCFKHGLLQPFGLSLMKHHILNDATVYHMLQKSAV